jgi:hypothetical protein
MMHLWILGLALALPFACGVWFLWLAGDLGMLLRGIAGVLIVSFALIAIAVLTVALAVYYQIRPPGEKSYIVAGQRIRVR